jgi:mRNA interferase RelE/StbE
MATTGADLRELIDRLPEDQLERAARLLKELGQSTRLFDEFLASVPEDDDPLTDEEPGVIAEGHEDYLAGRTVPLSDIPPRLQRISPRARRQLDRLDNGIVDAIQAALDRLASEDQSLNVIKLARGLASYRIRVGDYRIVFERESGSAAVVTNIAHRREVYRR